MPFYDVKCNSCEQTSEVHMSYSDFKEIVPCPQCGKDANVCINLPMTDVNDNPRWSQSLAVHPDQVASGEAHLAHPGATFDKDGRMLIRNRKEKLQRIKERNKLTGIEYHER